MNIKPTLIRNPSRLIGIRYRGNRIWGKYTRQMRSPAAKRIASNAYIFSKIFTMILPVKDPGVTAGEILMAQFFSSSRSLHYGICPVRSIGSALRPCFPAEKHPRSSLVLSHLVS